MLMDVDPHKKVGGLERPIGVGFAQRAPSPPDRR